MNSIQLISKINARIEDLAMLSQEVLQPNNELSNIEKEVLKRTCSDLYELVLKLKTSNDLSDEHIALKENISQEIRKEELNFKEIIANKIISEEVTINTLAETKLVEEEPVVEPIVPVFNQPIVPEIKVEAPVQEVENEPIVEVPQMPLFTFTHEPEEIKAEPVVIAEPIVEKPIEVVAPVVEAPKVEVVKEELVVIAEKQPEPVVIEPKQPEIIIEKEVEIPKVIVTPPAPPVQEVKPVVEAPKPIEPKPIVEESANKPNPFFSIGKTVMPSSEPSLNERIAQKMDGFQFSEKIVEPKIDSLKTAISLNKKIAFVNELFKENVVEYAKSIDKINGANNLSEAMLFWSEMKITHNWNNEHPLVKDLEKLIQRRFS